MTGEKNRLKTHEQLWKLEDGELSTPKHDELVLHLLNNKNAIKFLKLLGHTDNWQYSYSPTIFLESGKLYDGLMTEEKKEEHENFLTNLKIKAIEQARELVYSIDVPELEPLIDCEVPIQTGNNNFIIGYIDLRFKIKNYFGLETECFFETFEYELPGTQIKLIYKAYCKINAHNNSLGNEIINIEVKPKIRSFGETLRQINTYKTYSDGIYIIYSPDTRFKAAFETQGIKIITPSDLGLK
jgi:hypothetical protein